MANQVPKLDGDVVILTLDLLLSIAVLTTLNQNIPVQKKRVGGNTATEKVS